MKTSTTFVIEEWRDLWSYKGDFIIVCFVYVFSWSSILALPKLFVENGGGAFGVAYLTSLLICSLPMVMAELAVGQLCAKSPPKTMFNMSPAFAGVGLAHILLSLLQSSILVAYAGYLISFLARMFMGVDEGDDHQLAWMSCPSGGDEMTDKNFNNNQSLVTVHDYFRSNVLNASNGIEQSGELQWMLISASGLVWILVFAVLFLGVRWLGKVCYFTFTIPLLLVLTLLVKSLSSDGAGAMIHRAFDTDWDALYKPQTWMKAMSESLYGVGISYGAYITLGSFNKRDNNVTRDSLLIIFIHLIVSCLGMIFTAAMLGHLMIKCRVDAAQTLNNGFLQILNLLQAVGHFEHPKLWSALLLILFLFLVFNILHVLVLNVQVTFEDLFGDCSSSCLARSAICLAVCALGFVSTIGFNLQSGFAALQFIVKYVDLVCPWIIVAAQFIAIGWVYCAHLLAVDIGHATVGRLSKIVMYPLIELAYLLPAVPIFIVVVKLQQYAGHEDGIWTEVIGFTLATVILLPIPAAMVHRFVSTCVKGPGFSTVERFKYSFMSPMRYDVPKVAASPRYTSTAPGYVLLPHAPLAEPEQFNDMYGDRPLTQVSHA